MKNLKIRNIAVIAILGALSGVMLYFKFPIMIAPSFYKLEISDIPALIGGFAIGPWASVLICLIKNIINILSEGTTTAFVGEFSNFVISSALCVPAAIIYGRNKNKKNAIKALIIGSLIMSIVACLMNYYVLIPAYVKFMNFPLEAIIGMGSKINSNVNSLLTLVLICTLPFNIIKAICVSVITFFLYKRVSHLLKG